MESLSWQSYDGTEASSVVGDVRISESLTVEYLDVERELLAYLPPGYTETDETYPVVYMHDGQNLFDEAPSNDGEWEVDETMERLAEEGIEAIMIGIPNAGDLRPVEYSPFFDESAVPDDFDSPYEGIEPAGDAYADWLIETVVPLVEDSFRVSEDRRDRGVFGSSMGGLISLYSLFRDPEWFGFAGAMSPAIGGPWHEMFDLIEDAGLVDARIYVDVGSEEFPDDPDRSAEFEAGAERLVETLESLGYDDDLQFVYDEGAIHHEDAWARRFPDAIRFLLG
ncbi:MAG: alpha/beta hydrolase [Halapricum sp.]